jgi:hypothetical protein
MAAEDRNGEVVTDEECIDCTERERSFDALARGLANGSLSRRKALRLLGATLVGSALASIPGVSLAKPPPGTCKDVGFKCAANTECCSKNCIKNPQGNGKICGCPTGQTLCNNNNGCLSCNAPKVPNATTCQCECLPNPACTASGGTVNSSTCKCGNCPTGKVLSTDNLQCVQCNNANDCPAPTDQCQKATCTNNVCGFAADEGKSCNDHNPCTENDTCNAAGLCAGTQITGCVGCSSNGDCSGVAVTQCHEAFCNSTGVCEVRVTPGASCDDELRCTENDTCTAEGLCVGTPKTCPPSNNPCVARTECDPATGNCIEVPGNAGTECRPAQGECDLPAFCTGTSTTCPDNPLRDAGTVCREAAGPCDVAEVCTGTSAQCPANEFLPAGTVCLEAQGPCAGPSLCSGDSAQCPDNPLLPDTTVCREAAGPCDVPEFCTGTSDQCPENQFVPAGTICRDPTNQCEVAATCTGDSAVCPANGFKTNDTPCNNDNDLCTLETCQNGVCQSTGRQVQCPTPSDPCKVSVCVPATGICETRDAPNGTPCEDGNLCTLNDTCQNGTCRAGSPRTCPTSTDPCKVNVCVPATGNCVAQNAPNGTPCNDNNLCTTGEACQNGTCQGGTGKTCPAGQTCVPATGVCQCTTGVTCGTICCNSGQVCCPPGTNRAGQCRSNLNACQ